MGRSRAPGERGRRRRRPREREHRAHRDAHAVRARAQPDRRRCCPPRSRPRSSVPDRAPRRRGRAAVHHLHASSSPRSEIHLAALPRLRPERQPDDRRTSSPPSATASTAWSTASSSPRCPRAPTAGAARGVRARGRRGRAARAASVTLVIPLELAFGNPGLLQAVGLGPLLEGLGNERQYKNDEQIDDSMRSVLFQIPKPGNRDPAMLRDADDQARLLLGRPGPRRDRHRARARPRHAVVQRAAARLRAGARRRSFTAITGESTRASRAPRDQPPRPDRRPEHPRLHAAERRRRQDDPARQRRGRRGRHRRDPPHDPRRAAEGDLRAGT